MTLLIHLLRHGTTLWNQEGRFQGSSNVELNDAGWQQARALALCLASAPLAAVFASDLARAVCTARLVAEPHGLAVQTDRGLQELNQGDMEGKTRDYLTANYPGLLERWRADAASIRMPGGETMGELQERTWAAIQRIHAKHSDGEVAVVAHNLANCMILCKVADVPIKDFSQFHQEPGCHNTVELNGSVGRVLVVNDSSHLTQYDCDHPEGYGGR